jgi:hypothetical protein
MNDYKGITFTIRARNSDRTKITETILEDYPQSTIEFVDADVEIPEAAVEIPDGHRIFGSQLEVAPGQFRDITGEVLISTVNSLLHSLFSHRHDV